MTDLARVDRDTDGSRTPEKAAESSMERGGWAGIRDATTFGCLALALAPPRGRLCS